MYETEPLPKSLSELQGYLVRPPPGRQNLVRVNHLMEVCVSAESLAGGVAV